MNGMLEEDNGNKITMRVMCVSSFWTSVAFGFTTLYLSATVNSFDVTTGIYLTTAFLLGAFAPKAVQKFAETKMPMKGS